MAISMKWFDYHLKGIDNGIMDEPRTEYFLMGKNEWRQTEQFPPENVEAVSLFLSSKTGANTSKGDGKLIRNKRKAKGSDRFVYDPENPVPTVGGVNSHIMPSLSGIKDQAEVDLRNDVLVYTTDPMDEDTEIVGEVIAKLFVSSDVTDTDFTAKLSEVRPDGYVRIIEDGIAKTRFRNGFELKEAMIPGQVYEIEVQIGTTAIMIPEGHRIRLEISSSNFPKYPRNANTGINETNAVTFKKAKQTIYHSESYPSCLILPILADDKTVNK
jgi:putative CocE/NonD family hydrolase